jgi:quercetin dioxygenase-like cupin family protein
VTGDSLKLTPHESVTVRSNTPEALEVEVVLGPGKPPPPHFHPAQDEHFRVLEGQLRGRVEGRKWLLNPGDTLNVESHEVHQMWNPGPGETRAVWRTTPGGRTLEWFSAIDALHRQGRVGRRGLPTPPAIAVLLRKYRDVIRPAVKPRPLVHVALVPLALVGRLRGYGKSA